MKTIEFPELKDLITENIENKILRTDEIGFTIYNFLKDTSKWKDHYDFIYNEIGAFYWIQQLKGINFKSKEEAELYAFLDFCQKEGGKFWYLIKNKD
jgi:hypothetical protein